MKERMRFVTDWERDLCSIGGVVPVSQFVLFLGRRPRMAETPADVDRPAAIVEG